AMDPIAMLFDEPTSALDPEMINEVLDVMVALAKEGMTMMVVTHEMGFARRVANRVVFMDRGQIVEDAPTAEFFGKPRSERAQVFLPKFSHHGPARRVLPADSLTLRRSSARAGLSTRHGNSATCSSPSVSGKPSMRFMFCTACPEAPLLRLSSA